MPSGMRCGLAARADVGSCYNTGRKLAHMGTSACSQDWHCPTRMPLSVPIGGSTITIGDATTTCVRMISFDARCRENLRKVFAMDDDEIVGLSEIEGVKVNVEVFALVQVALLRSVQAAMNVLNIRTKAIVGHVEVPTSMIQSATLLSINMMIHASGAQCTLDAPPEAINMTNNSSGQLIYRCEHSPPHEWNTSGNQLP